jgi:hypothetical protein
MSIVEPSTSGDIPEIDDGLYTAVIKATEGKTLDAPDAFGQTEKLILEIELLEIDEVLHPWVNRKWNQRSNLFKIAQATGLDPDPNDSFDTKDLVGKHVRVMVETAEEGRWPRVTQWLKAATKARKPLAVPVDDDDNDVEFSTAGARG